MHRPDLIHCSGVVSRLSVTNLSAREWTFTEESTYSFWIISPSPKSSSTMIFGITVEALRGVSFFSRVNESASLLGSAGRFDIKARLLASISIEDLGFAFTTPRRCSRCANSRLRSIHPMYVSVGTASAATSGNVPLASLK